MGLRVDVVGAAVVVVVVDGGGGGADVVVTILVDSTGGCGSCGCYKCEY